MSKRLNRAKCKLCGTIIVSRHRHDHVSCKCGEIFVDGGNDYWRCGAKNFENFLRFENGKWSIVIGRKSEMTLEQIIEKFQEYITENMRMLSNHINEAESAKYGFEVSIIKRRHDDLFLVRYRLEQLLSQAGYKSLCRLVCFNPEIRSLESNSD